ncbi:sensor histidine kinase [Melittangium boletus]|uniref:histidine kinase n=1 Tax=Melittangium boletus DSM 14713 TaxID=1294270 RepID=A0A250IE27_9BACT|nr:ATP-binding protein [Melittangium boletus]ATB29493.1 hypothetical protein MEBOL_002943 [Melittangium boletus DSM 14713]
MPVTLRVLLVEARPGDLSRGVEVLRQGGFEVESHGVASAEALRAALSLGPWEVLLCAEDVPGLTPGAAVDVLRAAGVDLPLLVLSARRGEHAAGEVMRAGARDSFPLDGLERLPAAVAREVEQARLRREYTRVVGERSLLARAGEALARSLEFQETLEQVVRLVVPELADWCLVYCPDEHGGLKLMALSHEDPERVARGFELDRLFPLLPDATRGPMAVWRTGEARLIPDVDPSWLETLARSPEHLRVMLGMGLRSVIHVPLLGRLGPQGVMTLCATGSRAGFTPADLALCQDVARRAALALENARLYREAREAIRLRDDFLAVAAHELRTPLTTLGLQLSSLVQRSRDVASRGWGERLARSLRQVRRLGTLVETLLDVSLLSTGELPLSRERVDLGELVGEVCERFEAEAQAVGCALRLEVAPGLVGHWDRLRVEQVVSSFLANALKFGPRQPVDVWARAEGGRARVGVEDRGIGIPEEQLEPIFERFGRAVSSRSYGGLGLGLYLARRAAEAHGGRVWAERREEGGARFTLELPWEAP